MPSSFTKCQTTSACLASRTSPLTLRVGLRRAVAAAAPLPGHLQTPASIASSGGRLVIKASALDSQAVAAVTTEFGWSEHSWMWNGYRCRYLTAGCGKPVVLVHGFGACGRHWRRSIEALAAAGYKVWALDLLGQGASEKPLVNYTMELWRDQIADFMAEFVQEPAVLVGNSIGSLASVMVAAERPEGVAGLVLLNCAGGMNNKAIADDWRIKLALPLFWLIDFLLLQRGIAKRLFDAFRSRDNIRAVLLNVYCNKLAVDQELVDMIYEPSCDEGALEAFISILTGPPGPRPDKLLLEGVTDTPLLVLWGDTDSMTPVDGPVGRFFQGLPTRRANTDFQLLPRVGHCPMDDAPEAVHARLLPWLAEVHAEAAGA